MPSDSPDFDALLLSEIAQALRGARLEAIVVGNVASMLNGAPVTTQDVDLLVRDTPLNRRKLARFAKLLGGSPPMPISEMTDADRIIGYSIPVDILYDRIPGGLTFASVRSRSERVEIGRGWLKVADLADVVRSKEAAGRPKDVAVLPILRDALAVKRALKR